MKGRKKSGNKGGEVTFGFGRLGSLSSSDSSYFFRVGWVGIFRNKDCKEQSHSHKYTHTQRGTKQNNTFLIHTSVNGIHWSSTSSNFLSLHPITTSPICSQLTWLLHTPIPENKRFIWSHLSFPVRWHSFHKISEIAALA